MNPSDLHGLVQTAFNGRDLDGLVALYESDAWLFGPEGPVHGTDAIHAAWGGMLGMSEHIELETVYAIEQGELALLSNRWTATVDGGGEVSAVSAEVARRQPDGSWKYVIDNPDAAGALTE